MNVAARQPPVDRAEDSRRPVAHAGRNCWRIAPAQKVSFLVDGQEYFHRLDKALRRARKAVWLIGWDFNPDISLYPEDPDAPLLGDLLRSLVEATDALEIRILVWAMGPVYSSRSLDLFTDHEWANHPRIHLEFDARHPLRGCHHQKIVCIDDSLAFVGGIDLTGGRWDSHGHEAHDPARVKPSGDRYGPVHDVQAMMAGPAAASIGDVARARWKRATGEEIAALPDMPPAWPDDLPPELTDCEVAIARTNPGSLFRAGRREAMRLTLDALASAHGHIYIETQYLASFRIGRLLAARLREPDGPEIVILVTSSSRGIIEQFVMAHNRNRLIRRLRSADRFDRLRVGYAVVPGDGEEEVEVLLHSKVIVVDDTFARIGSSNLNNRSEGLDTECDVAFEPTTPANRAAISAFRDRLLAEHLASEPEDVASAIEAAGLVGALDSLNVHPRGIRHFDVGARDGKTKSLLGTSLLDPRMPYWPLQKLRAAATRLFGGLF